jgi:hypothetical protein
MLRQRSKGGQAKKTFAFSRPSTFTSLFHKAYVYELRFQVRRISSGFAGGLVKYQVFRVDVFFEARKS